MDDLTLCKKIAEIENLIFDDGGRYFRCMVLRNGEVYKYYDYNPLTNKALLFDLMVKYKVDIVHGKTLSEVKIYDDPEDNPLANISFYHEDSGYERPILECIIQSKD